jgi:hypothetical protein
MHKVLGWITEDDRRRTLQLKYSCTYARHERKY